MNQGLLAQGARGSSSPGPRVTEHGKGKLHRQARGPCSGHRGPGGAPRSSQSLAKGIVEESELATRTPQGFPRRPPHLRVALCHSVN